MKVILDASGAFVMLATPERGARMFEDATDVLAPELIVAEVFNARWKVERSGMAAPSIHNVLGLLTVSYSSALYRSQPTPQISHNV